MTNWFTKDLCLRFLVAALVVLSLSAPESLLANDTFEQGKVRVALAAGTGSAFGVRYISIRAGVGVFVLDGLETGVDVEQWLGDGPSITMLSPQMRYVLTLIPELNPYIGTFYKHWFVGDDLADVDTVGGRLGAFFVTAGGRMFVGGGAVYEQTLSACSDECAYWYPEIILSATF